MPRCRFKASVSLRFDDSAHLALAHAVEVAGGDPPAADWVVIDRRFELEHEGECSVGEAHVLVRVLAELALQAIDGEALFDSDLVGRRRFVAGQVATLSQRSVAAAEESREGANDDRDTAQFDEPSTDDDPRSYRRW